MADQPLVELAGQQGDLGLTEVMAEGAAGEADLFAAAGDQQGRIQLGPAFWGLEEGRGHGWTRAMRTPVLAKSGGVCLPCTGCHSRQELLRTARQLGYRLTRAALQNAWLEHHNAAEVQGEGKASNY